MFAYDLGVKSTDKAVLVVVAVVAAYLIWRHFNKGWSPAQTQQAAGAAGLTTRTTQLGTFATSTAFLGKSTTYKLDPAASLSGASSPNLAQRFLISLDRGVPGTFLTRWALG